MADVGTGTSMTFATSNFSAELLSVSLEGVSRPALKTSHLGTTNYDTFMKGDLTDPGEIQITFQYNPNTQPPINGAAETITITYPVPAGSSNGATHVGSGFLTDFSVTSELETVIQATATLKLSGTLTFNDAS